MVSWKRYDGAGGSATLRYRELRRQWRKRTFGRADKIVWPLLVVAALVVVALPKPFSTIMIGLVAGMAVGWWVLRDQPPDHIARWQRGAWGEQKTARALKPLKKQGWHFRHDLEGSSGNRDHVAVGRGVFLLDSKMLPDELTLEGTALRVTRIDNPRDSYLADGLTSWIKWSASQLSAEIRAATGERVWVYPVVVLWGLFEAGVVEVGGVTYIDGERLASWLAERPSTLDAHRREVVASWLCTRTQPFRREGNATQQTAVGSEDV